MYDTYATKIARKLLAIENCRKSGNAGWLDRHSDDLWSMVRDQMPSGGGFDNAKLDETSTPERLVFNVSFLHMNEGGMYDGWSDHSVIVTPSLVRGISIRVTGRDRNDIKNYIAETFHAALSQRSNITNGEHARNMAAAD